MLRSVILIVFIATSAFFAGRESTCFFNSDFRSVVPDSTIQSLSAAVDCSHETTQPSRPRQESRLLDERRSAQSVEFKEMLRLFGFVDSWRSVWLAEDDLGAASETQLVSFSTRIANEKDVKELYDKISESGAHLAIARQRFAGSDSLENKVTLACWLMLHGELLALPPVNRVSNSLRTLEEGVSMLEEMHGEFNTAQFEKLERSNAPVAILLQTVRARIPVIEVVLNNGTDTLIAENKEKTLLLDKYRSIVGQILTADSAFHLGDWDHASRAYLEAAALSRELDQRIANYQLRRSDGSALGDRRPFVFIAEPVAEQRNPEPLDFIENVALSKVVTSLSVLARMRFTQLDEKQPNADKLAQIDGALAQIDAPHSTVAADNPFGFLVRGLLREYRATLLFEGLLANPENTSEAAMREFKETRQAAADDLDKARQTIKSDLQAHTRSWKASRFFKFVSSSFNIHPLALGGLVQLDSGDEFINELVADAFNRVQSPDELRRKIYISLSERQLDEAWSFARQLLLRHGTEGQSWVDYIRTGIRTGQDARMLKANFQLVLSRGILRDESWKVDELAGILDLYSARKLLSGERAFLKALLLGDRAVRDKEQERVESAMDYLQLAVRHLDDALGKLPPDEKKETQMRIRADRAQAGALAFLISQDADPIILTRYMSDAAFARIVAQEKLRALKPSDIHKEIDLLDSLVASQYAEGVLLLASGDRRQIDHALSAIAASQDIAGRLNSSSFEHGTLLLSALLLRGEDSINAHADRQMRRGLQMLVEGLVLADLGSAESARDRVNRASTIFSSETPAIEEPISAVWSLLSEAQNEVDPATADKMARLTAFLLQIEQAATPHSGRLGDIISPTAVEAEAILTSALAAVRGTGPLSPTLEEMQDALLKTRSPVESMTIGLAAESKVRSLKLSVSDERGQWIRLVIQSIERSNSLQVEPESEFNKKFPLLTQLKGDMEKRLQLSDPTKEFDYYITSAEMATSRFRFDEAEERLRDGLAHRPRDSRLWFTLASLILTRLEVDDFASDLSISKKAGIENSFNDVLNAWNQHKPSDSWQRDMLQARFFSLTNRLADASESLRKAKQRIPEENKEGRALITAKQAELAATLVMRKHQD